MISLLETCSMEIEFRGHHFNFLELILNKKCALFKLASIHWVQSKSDDNVVKFQKLSIS